MSRVHHPVFARLFARLAPRMDAAGVAAHRQDLVAGLAGRVLEIGAGTGASFPHYGPGVTQLVAAEPEPYLRQIARTASEDTTIPVEVIDAVADSLPFPDASFDACVASLVLCSVADQAAALAEIRRVLRPEGELRFYEHVAAPTGTLLARLQSALDLVWPRIAGGCHTGRDTEAAVLAAGFEITSIRRFTFRPTLVAAPVAPHVIGTARRRPIAPEVHRASPDGARLP